MPEMDTRSHEPGQRERATRSVYESEQRDRAMRFQPQQGLTRPPISSPDLVNPKLSIPLGTGFPAGSRGGVSRLSAIMRYQSPLCSTSKVHAAPSPCLRQPALAFSPRRVMPETDTRSHEPGQRERATRSVYESEQRDRAMRFQPQQGLTRPPISSPDLVNPKLSIPLGTGFPAGSRGGVSRLSAIMRYQSPLCSTSKVHAAPSPCLRQPALAFSPRRVMPEKDTRSR